jgi:hypothetical protein
MANPTFNIVSGSIVKIAKGIFSANVIFKSIDGQRVSAAQRTEVLATTLAEAKKALSRSAWEWEHRIADVSTPPNVPTNTDIQADDENTL